MMLLILWLRICGVVVVWLGSLWVTWLVVILLFCLEQLEWRDFVE